MAFNDHLSRCQCPVGLVGSVCGGLPGLVLKPKPDFPESPGAVEVRGIFEQTSLSR